MNLEIFQSGVKVSIFFTCGLFDKHVTIVIYDRSDSSLYYKRVSLYDRKSCL